MVNTPCYFSIIDIHIYIRILVYSYTCHTKTNSSLESGPNDSHDMSHTIAMPTTHTHTHTHTHTQNAWSNSTPIEKKPSPEKAASPQASPSLPSLSTSLPSMHRDDVYGAEPRTPRRGEQEARGVAGTPTKTLGEGDSHEGVQYVSESACA